MADGGLADADQRDRCPPESQIAVPAEHSDFPFLGGELPNGLGSVYSRNWKRPSPCGCCVCDSYCIGLP